MRGALLVGGVASAGVFCSADKRLSILVADGKPFVRFAARGPFRAFCIDPLTGFVVHVVRPAGKPPTRPTFVNTSIVLFNLTVDSVLKSVSAQVVLPEEDNSPAASAELARAVRNEIARIDGAAIERDLHWDDVVSSIHMGDFHPAVMAWSDKHHGRR